MTDIFDGNVTESLVPPSRVGQSDGVKGTDASGFSVFWVTICAGSDACPLERWIKQEVPSNS